MSDAAQTERRFDGTSDRGDFIEALNNAVAAARSAALHMNWSLEEVSGEFGGIVGANRITVSIRVRSR